MNSSEKKRKEKNYLVLKSSIIITTKFLKELFQRKKSKLILKTIAEKEKTFILVLVFLLPCVLQKKMLPSGLTKLCTFC